MQRYLMIAFVLAWALGVGSGAYAQEAPEPETKQGEGATDVITVPAPERGVIYIRSGKPGGVRIRSRPGNVRRAAPASQQDAAAVQAIAASLLVDTLRLRGVQDTTALRIIRELAEEGAFQSQAVTQADLDRLEENLRAMMLASTTASVAAQSRSAPPERVEIVRTESGDPGVVFVPTPIPGRPTPLPDTLIATVPLGQAPLLIQPPAGGGFNPVVLPVMTAPTALQVERDMLETGLFRSLSINFETGKSTLLPPANQTLNAVGEVLLKYPEMRVEVAGHTDNVGSEALNQRLSQARAQSVVDYLQQTYAIDLERLVARGYGESSPIASNSGPTGRALNRRVEFQLLNPAAVEGRLAEREQADSLVQAQQMASIQASIQVVLREELRRMQATLDSAQAQQLAQLQQYAPDSTGQQLRVDSTGQAQIAVALTGVGQQDFDYDDPRNGFKAVLAQFGYATGYASQFTFGVRADIRAKLLIRMRLVPEFVFGSGDGSYSYHPSFYAMIGLPKIIIDPYIGIGVGWLGFSDAEAVGLEDSPGFTVNVPIGLEFSSGFFLEYTMIDWGDFNRFSLGYRIGF